MDESDIRNTAELLLKADPARAAAAAAQRANEAEAEGDIERTGYWQRVVLVIHELARLRPKDWA